MTLPVCLVGVVLVAQPSFLFHGQSLSALGVLMGCIGVSDSLQVFQVFQVSSCQGGALGVCRAAPTWPAISPLVCGCGMSEPCVCWVWLHACWKWVWASSVIL